MPVARTASLWRYVPAELDLLSRHGRVSEVGGELGVKADARLGADDHVGDTDAAERRRRVRGSPRPLVLDRHPPVDFEALGHERLHLIGLQLFLKALHEKIGRAHV